MKRSFLFFVSIAALVTQLSHAENPELLLTEAHLVCVNGKTKHIATKEDGSPFVVKGSLKLNEQQVNNRNDAYRLAVRNFENALSVVAYQQAKADAEHLLIVKEWKKSLSTANRLWNLAQVIRELVVIPMVLGVVCLPALITEGNFAPVGKTVSGIGLAIVWYLNEWVIPDFRSYPPKALRIEKPVRPLKPWFDVRDPNYGYFAAYLNEDVGRNLCREGDLKARMPLSHLIYNVTFGRRT